MEEKMIEAIMTHPLTSAWGIAIGCYIFTKNPGRSAFVGLTAATITAIGKFFLTFGGA